MRFMPEVTCFVFFLCVQTVRKGGGRPPTSIYGTEPEPETACHFEGDGTYLSDIIKPIYEFLKNKMGNKRYVQHY